jgi:membrane protein YqaA with SNARE-associated domain
MLAWNRWMLDLARRKTAVAWLAFFSFIESIFFPIPVDPMLAVMVAARPNRFVFLAMITTIFSTLGGVAGWYLGHEMGLVVIEWLGKIHEFEVVRAAFATHGWMLIMMGAFTPLPYKVTVISGGFLGVGLWPLIIASLLGRGCRFMLVAAIVRTRTNRPLATALVTLLLMLVGFFWWMVST